jgi:hypothetical protein
VQATQVKTSAEFTRARSRLGWIRRFVCDPLGLNLVFSTNSALTNAAASPATGFYRKRWFARAAFTRFEYQRAECPIALYSMGISLRT